LMFFMSEVPLYVIENVGNAEDLFERLNMLVMQPGDCLRTVVSI